jgi:hypothetical protein
MGMIIPAENMPHTAEGIIPDVIVNPHGLTSRMTVAQLIECLFGRMGVEVAAKCNGTSFFNRENIVKTVGDSLMELGMHPHSENVMYCGTTGKQLQCSVFMGPLYFMRMKHLTSDKINSRGEGRREIRTHQPTGGRGNEGGMRIGEMERDAVSAHGVSLFLQESMMKRSDGTTFWICNGCGTVPIYNEKESLFVCPMCDGPVEYSGTTAENLALIKPLKRSRVTFSKVEMPYSLKLLDQEVTTYTGTGLRFITDKSIGRLRDSVLNWSNKILEEGEEEEEEKPQSGGFFQPASPKLYVDEVKASMAIQPTETHLPTKEELNLMPEGASNEVIYGKALENDSPILSVSEIEIPKMVGGSAPLETVQDAEILTIGQNVGQYSMGSALSPLKQVGGTAPLDYVDNQESTGIEYADGIINQGPPAPPNFDSTIAEVSDKSDIPISNPIESPDFKQRGGMAPIEDTLGTEINQATFSMPSMDKEPFVVANPYVSPPILPNEVNMVAPNQVEHIPSDANQTATVSSELLSEVLTTVQQGGAPKQNDEMKNNVVFENAEIRVVKIQ